ncbi:GDP-mannose transporter [Thozetella sp. PMI_491]|nr:GDP-mannose transporter [Thozetella sp. PMI_491]
MSNKKNEDLEMRPREELGERDPFIGKGASHRRAPSNVAVGNAFSKLDNTPGASILAYCLASISMTVVNKYVVSGSEWNLHFFYLVIQSIVCVGAIMVCKQAGMIKNLAPFDTGKARRWFPISVLLVGMIYTGNKALQFLSVPVYTIFKNLTIIVIAYGEVLWFGGSVSPMSLLAFGLMVLSSVVAAWADIQAAINGIGHTGDSTAALSTLNAGYAWMSLNVFCTSSYVLGMRKVIKKMNFKDWDTMFYNNLLTIPVLVVCSLIAEDWSSDNLARNFPIESRNSLLIGMIYSGFGAIFISYCSAWCIRVTSSTTYSMVGALNKLPVAVSGLVFFDAPITFGSVSAIFIGFVSGIVYSWAKVRQSMKSSSLLPTTQPAMSASSQSHKDAANS